MHIDTSPDFNASHVNPQIIEAYNGQPIKLGESQRILDPDVFPELNKVVGHTLMVTDGTSLLGADDKAGVVEIMEGIKYLIDHPDVFPELNKVVGHTLMVTDDISTRRR